MSGHSEAMRRLLSGAPAPGRGVIESPAAPEESRYRPLEAFFAPPSTFSDEWGGKPTEPIEMGMRLASEKTLAEAQMMAARAAWLGHPEPLDVGKREDLYGSTLLTNVLSRVLTDAKDRHRLFFADAPEDLCRLALSTGGVRALWDRYARLAATHSPITPALSDAEVEGVAHRLLDGALDRVPTHVSTRLRRLLFEIFRELP